MPLAITGRWYVSKSCLRQALTSGALSHKKRSLLKEKPVTSLGRAVLVNSQLRGAARLNPPMPPGSPYVQGRVIGVACPQAGYPSTQKAFLASAQALVIKLDLAYVRRRCSLLPKLLDRLHALLAQASRQHPTSGHPQRNLKTIQ